MDASPAACETFADLLIHWYERHARSLPWRLPPGTPVPLNDPAWAYRVWLSEVMLQQTTVAAVIPRFAGFIERWPTVAALAAAPEAEVMAAWAGLGYYARARNLHACARIVAAQGGGNFPDSEQALRRLPGLGAYTAAAIAAIAFGRPAVVVDANVERVVARLFAIADPLPAARAAIHAAAAKVTPAIRAGDFAQAMMDLGSMVCTPRRPACRACPLNPVCAAARAGTPEAFPVKAAKKLRPLRRGTAYWIEKDGAVWLVRRPAAAMLGNMRALPDNGWTARADGTAPAPISGIWHSAGQVRHVFTHAELTLEVAVAGQAIQPLGPGEWWPIADLAQAGLPTLYARAAAIARAWGETAAP
jgi:A/G-specific adenine glycosylase